MSNFNVGGRKTILAILAAAVVTSGAATARAQGGDANIDAAQKIIELSLGDTRDGILVRLALKTLKDPALAPLFQKMRASTNTGTQLDAMMALAITLKDPKQLDMNIVTGGRDDARIGAALAQLIESEQISDEQLKGVMEKETLEMSHRMLAAGELSRRKKLTDKSLLLKAIEKDATDPTRSDMVRHYAALTLLENKDEKENEVALKVLMDMLAPRDKRLERAQEVMILRIYKDKLTLALPWVKAIAEDVGPAAPGKAQVSPRLAMTALAAMLALKDPDAPKIFEMHVAARTELSDQLTLGLMGVEFADRLTEANLAKLGEGRSSQLVKAVKDLAHKAVKAKGEGQEVTDAVIALLQEGQPIVLNWALGYAISQPKERQIAVRTALIKQASILDEARATDYERAAMAAQKLMEDGGKEGRAELAAILKGNVRAPVEAILLGMLRSDAKECSELILPGYKGWCESPSSENAANYATLILAREGKKEALGWLAGMINGGNVQNIGFRALAGWQYAKIKGEEKKLLDKVIASAPAATKPK